MRTAALKSISLIFSPYHVGLRNVGPGAGPSFIYSRGLVRAVEKLGIAVREVEIEPVDSYEGEIGRSFEVIRRSSRLVTEARNGGSFPIVLSGNCSAAVGVAAGLCASDSLKDEQLSCVWFDAHDDFNTPDTVVSGYFDSMPVAMLAGQCWRGMLGTVPGHRPLSLERLVQVGMRDVTDAERARVEGAGFDVIWGSVKKKVDFSKELQRVLQMKQLGPTMVHLDLDCLDNSLGKVNKFAAPGGLLEDDLAGCMQNIVARTRPASLTVASFDPSYEGAERIADIAVRTIETFIQSLIKSGLLLLQNRP